jgi:hypothetical protein
LNEKIIGISKLSSATRQSALGGPDVLRHQVALILLLSESVNLGCASGLISCKPLIQILKCLLVLSWKRQGRLFSELAPGPSAFSCINRYFRKCLTLTKNSLEIYIYFCATSLFCGLFVSAQASSTRSFDRLLVLIECDPADAQFGAGEVGVEACLLRLPGKELGVRGESALLRLISSCKVWKNSGKGSRSTIREYDRRC